MPTQPFYEDIEVGIEIPQLVKHPTTRQLVKWAGASGDYYEIHYDKDFAQKAKLPGVIVHGMLQQAFLGQLVTNWMGVQGTLKKLSCRNRDVLFPGEDVVCKGKVIDKYVQGGEHCVECDVWVEDSKGRVTTSGKAVITLPSRMAVS